MEKWIGIAVLFAVLAQNGMIFWFLLTKTLGGVKPERARKQEKNAEQKRREREDRNFREYNGFVQDDADN